MNHICLVSDIIAISSLLYMCSKKRWDLVFDDKMNNNCPFTKLFGTLITKTIGHRQVFFIFPPYLFSTATLPWELSRSKYQIPAQHQNLISSRGSPLPVPTTFGKRPFTAIVSYHADRQSDRSERTTT